MKQNEKKYTRKSVILFIVVIIVCGGGGFFLGNKVGERIADGTNIVALSEGFLKVLSYALPIIFAAANLALCLLTLAKLRKARTLSQDAEADDEKAEAAEQALNLPMLLARFCLLANLMLYTVCCWLTLIRSLPESPAMFILSVCTLFFGLVWTFAVIALSVGILKKLNPERRGTIFDFGFQKKWDASSGEGEMLAAYKSAYRAFNVGMTGGVFLWLLLFLLMFVTEIGVVPCLSVGALMLLQLVVYSVQEIRLQHGN